MKRTDAVVIQRQPAMLSDGLRLVLPVVGLAFLTLASTFVRIPLPFTPVPVTLQTLVVLLGAAMLGRGRGVAAQGLYLGLGSVGLPLVAGGAVGLGLLLSPTGGYLIGFLVAAAIVGHMLKGERASLLKTTLAMGFGSLTILALGAAHLVVVWGFGFQQAFVMGILPFLLWEGVKLVVAISTYQLMTSRK